MRPQSAFTWHRSDPRQKLVIDPVLNYSTYLGGSGDEQVAGITVDANGSAYIVGSTDSADFPFTTFGSASSDSQVFVAKLDATGSNLLFCDFLGGAGQDNGYGIALDGTNNVVVTGSTASDDFPSSMRSRRPIPDPPTHFSRRSRRMAPR